MSNQNFDDVNDVVSARLRKHAAEIERLNAVHQQQLAESEKCAMMYSNDVLRFQALYKNASKEADKYFDQASSYKSWSLRWKWLFVGAFIAVAILTIQSEVRIHGLKEDLRATQAMLDEARKPWRSDDAPKLQRLTVVAEGFMDKKGEWRSFDDGSHLTVKQWKQ